jgi:hypothetical protein
MIFRVCRKIGTQIGTVVGPGFLTGVCKLGIGTWFRVCSGDALRSCACKLQGMHVFIYSWCGLQAGFCLTKTNMLKRRTSGN